MEVKNEQSHLLRSVQDEFSHHVEDSRTVLLAALTRELPVTTGLYDQNRVVDKLADLIKHALNSMGEFQRASIERPSKRTVADAVEEVADRVNEVKSQVQSLTSVLPTSEAKPKMLLPPAEN